jgi:uncharacterized ubiquitin-like protein YukD
MTVKEVIKLLKEAEVISIGLADQAIRIDSKDALMLNVFGDYVVDNILTDDGKIFELNVALLPVKAGA